MALPTPPGTAETAELIKAFDAVLADGFARLTPSHTAALDELSSAFAGTPLGSLVSAATTGLGKGELLAHHLVALAAARASLQGARTDALLQAAADALSLSLKAPESQPAPAPSAEAATRMASCQQWLTELGLAGLTQLDNAALVPIMATLDGMQQAPELQRLAALITGFANELLDHAPTSAVDEPPLTRWADLWCRAILLTAALPDQGAVREVSGTLWPLAADVRHHDHLFGLVVHSVLETNGERLLVQTPLTAWKVDAITGGELWALVKPLAPQLLESLATPKALTITGMKLTGNTLEWGGRAMPGDAFDPFALDLAGCTLLSPLPRDRHPLQVAIPVNSELPAELSDARMSPHAGITPADANNAKEHIGLLRYDDDWSVQPVAGRKGKKVYGAPMALAAAAKVKKPAVSILRERASKLLRS